MLSRLRRKLNVGNSFKDCARIIFSHGGPLLIGLLLVLPQTVCTCYFYDRYVSWLFFRAHFFKIPWMIGLALAGVLLTLSLNYVIAMATAITAVKNHKNPRKLDDKAQQKEILNSVKTLLPKGMQMVIVCWAMLFLMKQLLAFLANKWPAQAHWVTPSVSTFGAFLFTYVLCDHMRSYHWILYQYHGASDKEKQDVWAKSQRFLAKKRMLITCSRYLFALPLVLVSMMFWAISRMVDMPFEILFHSWKTKAMAMFFFQCCFLLFIMMRLLFHIDLAKRHAAVVKGADVSDALDDVLNLQADSATKSSKKELPNLKQAAGTKETKREGANPEQAAGAKKTKREDANPEQAAGAKETKREGANPKQAAGTKKTKRGGANPKQAAGAKKTEKAIKTTDSPKKDG